MVRRSVIHLVLSAVLTWVLGSFVPQFAFASGVGVTYHGRLLKPDGTPVTSSSVQFRIQIRTPGAENCLMYEEISTKDLSTSSGAFAITVNDGTATSLNTEPFTFDRIFQNRGLFTFLGGKCAAVGTYAPNPADGRKMNVEFNDGTFGGWETLPSQDIAYVPYAIESMTVGGFNADSLLKVVDGSGNPAVATPLSPAQYTEFGNLLSGASAQYVHAGGNSAGFTGSLAGDVTGTQGATSVGKLLGRTLDTTPPSNGQVLMWNNVSSRWEPSTPAASGVTNIATGTGLSGGPITTTGTISLANTTVTSGTYGSATQVPVFTVDAQGRLTSATNTTISGVAPGGAAGGDLTGTYPSPTINAAAVTGAKIAANTIGVGNLSTTGASTGQTYRYTGAAWAISKLGYTDLVNSFSASPWPTVTCTSGQFIIWQSSTDSFVCSSLTGAQVNAALGYTAANGSSYVAKAGDTMTGALVLPTDGLTLGTTQLVASGGFVGIGTATPGAMLDVNGQIKVRGGTPGAGKVLTSDAAGLATWQTPSAGGLTSVGLTAPSELTITGSPLTANGSITAAWANQTQAKVFASPTGSTGVPAFRAIAATDLPSIASGMTGILPVANGGTGVATITSGSLMVGAGTSAITGIAAGASGNVLYGTGAAAWSAGTPDTAGLVDKASAQTIAGTKTFTSLITTNLKVTGGTPASGSVLTSDASGNATWAVPSTGMTGSGTTGYIPKFTGASALGNSTMIETATGIGIGTATPATKLHVLSNINNDTQALIVSENTNAGTSASAGFSVRNNSGEMGYLWTGSSAYTGGGSNFQNRMTLSASAASTGLSLVSEGAGDDMRFLTGGSTAAFERMRIDPNGNVGIGTTNPGFALDVTKDGGTYSDLVRVRNLANTGSSSILYVDDAGTLQGYTGYGNSGLGGTYGSSFFFATNAKPLQFATNETGIGDGTVRMVIKPTTGNVGIGTTTPGYKLDVNGQLNGTQVCVAGDCRSAWPAAGSVSSVPLTTKLTAADLAAGSFSAVVDFSPNFNVAAINTLGGANLAADRVDIPSDGIYQIIASAYYCPQTTHYSATKILVNGAVVVTQGSSVASGCRTDTAVTVQSLTTGQYVSMTMYDSQNGPSMGIINIQLTVTKMNSHGTTNLADADGNTKVEVERSANDDMIRFATAGSDRMTIAAGGNVGIGTTTPATELDVNGYVTRKLYRATGTTAFSGTSGAMTGRSLTITKAAAGTDLLIQYSDTFGAQGANASLGVTCSYEVKVDGASCSTPLVQRAYVFNTTGSSVVNIQPGTLMGYCSGISSGSHTLTVTATGTNATNCYGSYNSSPWTLTAEEVR